MGWRVSACVTYQISWRSVRRLMAFFLIFKMRQRIKFRGDWSSRCWDMAIFRFFKWQPSAILDLLYACLNHSWTVFDSLYHFAKFDWNRCSSFDSMQVLMFYEMPIHARRKVFWGTWPCKWEAVSSRPPKDTLRENTSWHTRIDRQNPSTRGVIQISRAEFYREEVVLRRIPWKVSWGSRFFTVNILRPANY